MKFVLYYLVHAVINVAAILLLREKLTVSAGSIAPLAIMVLMLIQALFTFNESNALDSTAHSEADRLTSDEKNLLVKHLKTVFLLITPFALPFVFFFPLYAKLLSCALYFLAFIIGGVSFKLIHGRNISDRLHKEASELAEQKKKEENGNI